MAQIKGTTKKGPIDPSFYGARVSFDFWAPVYEQADGTLMSPGFIGNTFSTNTWDTVVFGGSALTPGIAEVSIKKDRDVDKKKTPGANGARVTVLGQEPGVAEIRLIIWTPEQLKALQDLWAILFPKAGKGSPPAIDVSHPLFKFHNIKSVIVTGGDGPVRSGVNRAREFVLRAIEYFPPNPKKGKNTPIKSTGSLLDDTSNKAPEHPLPGTNPENRGP